MKEIIKFEASWCNQCKALDKILEKADFEIKHYDVDEYEDLADKHNIVNLPTMILLEDGKEVTRFNGIKPLNEIKELFNI